jgi:hypothetical protein
MKYAYIIMIAFLAPAECFSQTLIDGEFSDGVGYFHAEIGTRVVLSTWFSASSSNGRIEKPPQPIFKHDSSIEVIVAGIFDELAYFEDSLVIYITSNAPRCYIPPGDGVVAYIDSQDVYPGFPLFALSGFFYDPNIIGKISGPDSLYFGSISDDTSANDHLGLRNDSLAAYRPIKVLSVDKPFSLDDAIEILYPCQYYYNYTPNCSFHPTAPGHYVDTAKLLDPLTNDTISVVLIGDAYDAGVNSVPEPQIKLFPNPCDRELNIDIPSEEVSQIKIYNLFGECVFSSKLQSGEATIDCSHLLSGIYFVSIDGVTSPQKLIVAH